MMIRLLGNASCGEEEALCLDGTDNDEDGYPTVTILSVRGSGVCYLLRRGQY